MRTGIIALLNEYYRVEQIFQGMRYYGDVWLLVAMVIFSCYSD